MGKLNIKHFIALHDLTPQEVTKVLSLAKELKTAQRKKGTGSLPLKGKTIALIFTKPSTRTRLSFETGMAQLGGQAIYLDTQQIQWGVREPAEDVVRTVSRYVDGIVYRGTQKELEAVVKHSKVPVINGLTELLHPCQALSDLLTIQEKKKKFAGLKLGYLGDGNNVCHSLMFASAKTGMYMSIASPRGYEPNDKLVNMARKDSRELKGRLLVTNDIKYTTKDADILYTDVWTSMGEEEHAESRAKKFKTFQLNSSALGRAKKDCIVMHCLPAHRGEEITGEILEGSHSVVFDQAENRLHVQKALLTLLLS